MKWPRNPLITPHRGRPEPSRACEQIGCDAHWYPIGEALIRQCDRCGHVSAIVTGPAPPSTPSGPGQTRWIAAIQPTDDRPAEGWPGCLD